MWDDETDWLEPNHIGVWFKFFWHALPLREWTPEGLASLVIDSVWH